MANVSYASIDEMGITGFPRDIDLFEQLDAPLALPRDKTQE